MIRIGADPGMTGAIAWIHPEGRPIIHDMPTMGERKAINAPALMDILGQARGASSDILHVYLEHAQAMPGQGVSSTFAYGRGFGTVEGVIYALGIPHTLIRPAVWKRRAGLSDSKADAIARAIQVCPAAAPFLKLKKHHGRAEALLIAIFGGAA
jgi:crossover junction endodeoxyribonuclease RuvC